MKLCLCTPRKAFRNQFFKNLRIPRQHSRKVLTQPSMTVFIISKRNIQPYILSLQGKSEAKIGAPQGHLFGVLTLWYQKQKTKPRSESADDSFTEMITPMTWNMRILKQDKSSYPEDESHFYQLQFPSVSTVSVSKMKCNAWLSQAFFYDTSSLSQRFLCD